MHYLFFSSRNSKTNIFTDVSVVFFFVQNPVIKLIQYCSTTLQLKLK